MLRSVTLFCAALALSACASVNGNGARSSKGGGGLGSDLRIFLDDSCLPAEKTAEYSVRGLGDLEGVAGVFGDIAVGIGGIAFKSFGALLEEAGSPRTSGTTGVATDMFFADGLAGSDTREMNRKVRCVHVVRDGFASRPALSSVPDEFGSVWTDLGLTSEPSLYALIELEPASDRSAHFRGRLTRLLLNRNELAGLEGGTRDMMLFLEFSSPTAGATVTEDELGNKFVQPGGPFAVGMIPLPGVEKGRIQTTRELKGVQTSWMSSPAAGEKDGDFPFNLHIDVVEMKRGNPMMADIGRMLQSEAIVSRVEDEVAYAINPEPRRRQQSDTVFEQRRAQPVCCVSWRMPAFL